MTSISISELPGMPAAGATVVRADSAPSAPSAERWLTHDGEFVFDGDFGPAPEEGQEWPPSRSFGKEYYTYQLLLDLKVDKEWAVRTEPHPRFYKRQSAGQR